tara:strand:+ start:188 stop:358 length:171 start_codon:yes stop_codon:yes gene_type:complete
MEVGTLVLAKTDGFIGVVIAIAGEEIHGYAEIITKPDNEGYTRRVYPTQLLEVICN